MNDDNKATVSPSRPLIGSTRCDDGEDICSPFCSSIDALIFADNEIICGNPDCQAYPKIKVRRN